MSPLAGSATRSGSTSASLCGAALPTMSPSSSNSTTDGVVRSPWRLGTVIGRPELSSCGHDRVRCPKINSDDWFRSLSHAGLPQVCVHPTE